ncbi:MAG: hypothetical protein KKD56_03830 [Acidobacteria bacterium]|nr:hypothetical protein [Acidobacteriota bacterium]
MEQNQKYGDSMKKILSLSIILFLAIPLLSQSGDRNEGLIPAFRLEPNPVTLERLARPGTPFDKVGRKFAILGEESGAFEAWAYPLKLFRNFSLSFLVGTSTRPVAAADIVRRIEVTPEATTLTYTYQSFTVKAIYVTPVQTAGAMILLDIDSNVPLTVICGFLPVLQPMWPAGIGGQYAYWNNRYKAYVISESSGKNHAFVGSPAASGISYTPAHMLSDNPSEFKIEIPDPKKVRGSYVPIFMAGGPGQHDDIRQIYESLQADPEKLYRDTALHYRTLRENTLQIQTPEPALDSALEWAKVSFDNLMVDNPNLGKGMIAGLGVSGTSGRPGFGWFFGGDSSINALSLLGLGAHGDVRDILLFNLKWQREDGKMAHELTQAEGYVDWWNDYGYGYIHGDTTPYFITVVDAYVRQTGDTEFVVQNWESLQKAYAWCLATDANGDGLMDNKKAGLGALEYGALTGIETDIYIGAVWVRAAQAMSRMAEWAGDPETAARAQADYLKAKSAFDTKFWDDTEGFYAYAFNAEGKRVKEISPWNAVGLMWELGQPDRSKRSLEKLCSAELMTDWGIRSISIKSSHFQPLNYNYGAVWPFLTSWVTAALYTHHLPLQGYAALMSTVLHTYDNSLGNLTEVFSGTHYIWPQEAVSHQGFSTAGVVLPTVKGLLGLDGDTADRTARFAPQLPGDWESMSVTNHRIGDALFSYDYRKMDTAVIMMVNAANADGYTFHFEPAFAAGTRITGAFLDGKPIPFQNMESGQVLLARVSAAVGPESMIFKLTFEPTVEILPVLPETRVGDASRGLRILRCERTEKGLMMVLEGIAGSTYTIPVRNADMILEVKGAEKKNNHLLITIPAGKTDEYVLHRVELSIASR